MDDYTWQPHRPCKFCNYNSVTQKVDITMDRVFFFLKHKISKTKQDSTFPAFSFSRIIVQHLSGETRHHCGFMPFCITQTGCQPSTESLHQAAAKQDLQVRHICLKWTRSQDIRLSPSDLLSLSAYIQAGHICINFTVPSTPENKILCRI